MKKRSISGFSSVLVSLPCLFAFFVFIVMAGVFGQTVIVGFCLFVFLTGGFSRLWGVLSVRKVTVDICACSAHMFVGDSINVSFGVQNEKILPLIWLELLMPTPRNRCLMPDGDFEVLTVTPQEEESVGGDTVLKKRFAFIMGGETLTHSCPWSAKRRGIYRADALILRSGDGFGLTQSQTVTFPEKAPVFVIYPRIVPVDITPFLSAQWDGTGGERGFVDDLTVMRGMKKYETGDSWKRINWRMAARGQDLNVNLYETVTPKAIHFVLDGESFCNPANDDSEFEETVSLLASVLLRLTEAGVMCGLSLPRSLYMPRTDAAATKEASELMTLLANYELLSQRDRENLTEPIHKAVFLPSEFEARSLMGAVQSAGRTYYIARDAKGLRGRGFPQGLDASRLTALTYHEVSDEDPEALGVGCKCFPSFGRRI